MRSLTYGDITWHDCVSVADEQLFTLQKQYGFHELDIEDCVSMHERPKVEEYDDYMFLVMHIPYFSKKSGRILKEEVNIFIGQSYVVTLHEGNLPQLSELAEQLHAREEQRKEFLEFGTGFFLYELMNVFFDGVFPMVDSITRDLRAIEDTLFENDDRIDLLRDIMTLKRNIITLRSILLPQRTVVATLEHKSKKFVSDDLSLYFDDIQDAIERQWALLDTAKELSDALQDTHESWLSHRTNSVVKLLTIFSVTMLPLTFITGLYGMNVTLPYQEQPYTFISIILLMVILLGGMLTYFAKKHWY